MMRTGGPRRRMNGLTLIELMVAIAITATLLTIAVGGFGGVFTRKRVEGAAAELAGDLQFARAEAVSRQQLIHVTFGTNCYLVHSAVAASTDASCTSAGTGGTIIKQVALDRATLSIAPNNFHHYRFDPVRGTITSQTSVNAAVADGAAVIGVANGPWQLRVASSLSGRTAVCSPSSTTPGYTPCP